ncbi:MAG: hypothetical protein KGH91_03020 [Rhodospirillales bacterium]|nr:hypothetical protein [Rhodospirillales bacterium]
MLTINPITTPGYTGVPMEISGTIWPATHRLNIGITENENTAPAMMTQIGANDAGLWSITLTPNWTGPVFVWAQELALTDDKVLLAVSRDRGYSFEDERAATLGAPGQRTAVVQFRRLGMGRDVVFRLRWSTAYRTALQGAFIDVEPCQS